MSIGSVTIGGITIPLGDVAKLGDAVPKIILGVGAHKSAGEIISELEPAVLPVLEDIAALALAGVLPSLIPGGALVAGLALMIKTSRPATRQEEENLFQRMSRE